MVFEGLVSVVIPVYRSESYLADTVGELMAFLGPRARFEIVLVNDGSPDGVQQVIDGLRERDARVTAFTLGRNLGQHRATLLGLARARGDVVVTLDDDGQNPPAAAWAVVEALVERRLDVVYGHFETMEQTWLRRVASAVNRWLSARMLENDAGISLSNVRAIRGELARAMGAIESSYPYVDALVFRMTRHIGQIPVEHRARLRGQSTYSLSKLTKLWISHLTTLSVKPLAIAMAGSFGVSAFGLLVGIAQIARVLTERKAPPGWLSLFCAVTFLFSVLFAFLGIISAYLGRMYVALNERGIAWIRSPQSTLDAGGAEEQPPATGSAAGVAPKA